MEIIASYLDNKKLADLHIHTKHGDGLLTPTQIVDLAVCLGLNTIAVTDHDQLEPSIEAKEYCYKHDYPLEVLLGAEISTGWGHLLAVGIKRNIRSGKKWQWTVEEIHNQGGLAILAHPALSREATRKKIITSLKQKEVFLDGCEVYNGSLCGWPVLCECNQANWEFYRTYSQYLGAAVGGSDAHFGSIATGLTAYDGSLLEDIQQRTTTAQAGFVSERLNVYEVARMLGLGLGKLPLIRTYNWIQELLRPSTS